MKKTTYFLIVLFSAFNWMIGNELKAQLSYRVLFLGNSYTGVNNLPQLVHDVALSAGDSLFFDSYTPGGFSLEDHCLDVTSQNKIMAGGWNYVVIQGQSQEPVTHFSRFFSGGNALNSRIKQFNECAVTMSYMTWGRKNGDVTNCPSIPVMCTYEGMDTSLREAYLFLTKFIDAEVSPVSIVWKYLRQNYPAIELYQTDESHPSLAGSYAAACCFYSTIFKKDPTLITFDFGLDATDASIIRDAAKTQVFNNLQMWDYKKMPIADFRFDIGTGTNEIIFNALPHGVQQSYFWDFGDGSTDTNSYSTHFYLADGTYTVTLTSTNCDLQGVHTSTKDTVIQFCSHTPTVYASSSLLCNYDTLWTQVADSYQWFAYGLPIPETNQYLPNYYRYGTTGFSVLSTLNGCAELSTPSTISAQWSGYYFDEIGDPCIGDTVPFIVLHTNGFLSGLENIFWYKNDTLLSSMTNEDTLLITASGKYECRVVNPASDCPLDTTYTSIQYDCSVIGIDERSQESFLTIFPNPASEVITIEFAKTPIEETIQIFNAIGQVSKSIITSATTTKINIADLTSGVYFIRLKKGNRSAWKFIKR